MRYNKERRQLELEEESRLNGGKRTSDRDIKHIEKKSESLTPYGKRITSATVKEVGKELMDYLKVFRKMPQFLQKQKNILPVQTEEILFQLPELEIF